MNTLWRFPWKFVYNVSKYLIYTKGTNKVHGWANFQLLEKKKNILFEMFCALNEDNLDFYINCYEILYFDADSIL